MLGSLRVQNIATDWVAIVLSLIFCEINVSPNTSFLAISNNYLKHTNQNRALKKLIKVVTNRENGLNMLLV